MCFMCRDGICYKCGFNGLMIGMGSCPKCKHDWSGPVNYD